MSNRRRHWKQRFDASAAMVFTRRIKWGGKQREAGDDVPAGLHPNKLRMMWKSGYIQLKDWTPPNSAPAPEGMAQVLEHGRGWFTVTLPGQDPKKMQGRAKVEAFLDVSGFKPDGTPKPDEPKPLIEQTVYTSGGFSIKIEDATQEDIDAVKEQFPES